METPQKYIFSWIFSLYFALRIFLLKCPSNVTKINVNWGETAQWRISIFHYINSSWSIVKNPLEYKERSFSSPCIAFKRGVIMSQTVSALFLIDSCVIFVHKVSSRSMLYVQTSLRPDVLNEVCQQT